MSTTAALVPLAQRRIALTARNPRQIGIPLLTPILFAVVIAPALTTALGGLHTKLDYTAFVSIGTVGLLVPLTTVFAGLSVIIDRDSGAQRELLAAPVPRALLVLGNLAVALVLSALQVAVLIGVVDPPRRRLHVSATGVAWFVAAARALRGAHVRRRRDPRQPRAQAGGVHRRDARWSRSCPGSSPGRSSRSARCPAP